jgi:hypothetical protein
MTNDLQLFVAEKLYCKQCDYTTDRKWCYDKHILTAKHKIRTNTNDLQHLVATKHEPKEYKCDCGKHYIHASSLWNHKQKCVKMPHSMEAAKQSHDDIQTNLILELVKQNQEFKELLIQQSNQLLEQNKTMIDGTKHNNQVNNTINSHNNNKTFNLNVFLNETCKDAMNMKDFIKSLQLNLTDLEKVGELGFAEGISRMFLRGLNSLDVTKRPIHCSDVKREIMHIKNEDKWEKDNANQDKLKNIIKQLTHKNIMMLDDWKKANPGCTEYNSKKYDHYLKLTMESMGPTDDDAEKRDFNKIIRRVAENTAIDKKYVTL